MRSTPAIACGLILLIVPAAHGAPSASAAKLDPKLLAEGQRLSRAARDDRAEVTGAQAQIAHLQARLVQLAAVEAVSERGAGDKTSRLAQLNAEEQSLVARLGEQQNATARLLGVLALFRRDPPPALLVHPQSAKDAVRAQILARAIAPALQDRSRAVAAQIETLRRVRLQVEGAGEDLFRAERDLADQRTALESDMARLAALQRALNADAQANDARLRALAAKSKLPADLIGRLPTEAAALGPAPVRFVEPVQGQLAVRFGQVDGAGPAQGYRWKTTPGAPVLAPAAGVVEYAGPLRDYGVILILRTGGAYRLVLAGLGSASAVVVALVAAGEPVGRMADIADADPRLYLEVRRGGEPVDPARWFNLAGH